MRSMSVIYKNNVQSSSLLNQPECSNIGKVVSGSRTGVRFAPNLGTRINFFFSGVAEMSHSRWIVKQLGGGAVHRWRPISIFLLILKQKKHKYFDLVIAKIEQEN